MRNKTLQSVHPETDNKPDCSTQLRNQSYKPNSSIGQERDWALTGDATPSSDITGIVVGEDEVGSRETSGSDCVREGNW